MRREVRITVDDECQLCRGVGKSIVFVTDARMSRAAGSERTSHLYEVCPCVRFEKVEGEHG